MTHRCSLWARFLRAVAARSLDCGELAFDRPFLWHVAAMQPSHYWILLCALVAVPLRSQAELPQAAPSGKSPDAGVPQGFCAGEKRAACRTEAHRLWKGSFAERNPQRAAALLALLCRQGDAAACVEEGDLHRNGDGVPLSKVTAADSYQRACTAGLQGACVKLGQVLLDGVKLPPGVPTQGGILLTQVDGGEPYADLSRDAERAIGLFKQACDHGDPSGCTQLGLAYQLGQDIAPDRHQAATLLRRACGQNDAAKSARPRGEETHRASPDEGDIERPPQNDGYACLLLGVFYSRGTAAKEQKRQALSLLEARCSAGQGAGCYGLGAYYRHLARPDRQRTLSLYQRACDLKYPLGCHDLGVILDEGTFATADPGRAEALLRKACSELDHGTACFNLAAMYDKGQPGIAADRGKAITAAERGCALGEPRACYNLGYLYLADGVGHDEAQAQVLFSQGCQRREPDACNKLGLMALRGQGQPPHPARALRYFRQACSFGLALGCTNSGLVLLDHDSEPQLRDEARGLDFLRQGCRGNDQNACSVLKQLQASEPH